MDEARLPHKAILVTPEYPTSQPDRGGLATFLMRFAQALSSHGLEISVLVLADKNAELWDGAIRVLHVARLDCGWRWLPRRLTLFLRPLEIMINAWRLRSRLSALSGATTLRFVHVSDLQAVGLFLGKRWRGAPVILRCSWVRRDYARLDGTLRQWGEQLTVRLEEAAVRRALFAYAPSLDTKMRYERILSRTIHVLRPPLAAKVTTARNRDQGSRILHFAGYLCYRKGSDLAARAMAMARAKDDSVHGQLVGRVGSGTIEGWLRTDLSTMRGLEHCQPLERREMQKLLENACCVVLPSRADNLPNAALEALIMGIPVITTRGSSIDEVVRDGIDGYVVDQEDAEAISARILDIWQRRGRVHRPILWDHPLRPQMEPKIAVAAFIQTVEALQPVDASNLNSAL